MPQARETEEVPLERADLRTIGAEYLTAILPALQFQQREAQRELHHMSFCAVGVLLSSFGRKPWLSAPGAGRRPEST